jgi:hypothetical protein
VYLGVPYAFNKTSSLLITRKCPYRLALITYR